jgi:hypothetical protein
LIISVVASTSIATADEIEAPFQNSSWHLTPTLLVGIEHFHYSEGDQQPAIVLDSQSGVLPTAHLSVEVTSPRSRFYARATFGFTDGSMTYDGATQGGTPLSGPTSGYMTDIEAIAGGRGNIARNIWLGGYLGFGHHTWERDLRPIGTAGYLEDYAWSYLPVGVVLDVAITPRLTVTADASLEFGVQAGTNLHISDFPLTATTQADPLDVGLNVDLGERLQISGKYALTREIRLIAVAGIETFQIDDGPQTLLTVNGLPVTDSMTGMPLGLAEPFSKTTRYTFDIGASYTF